MPVQVWATWFPQDGKPQSFIQGFPLEGLDLSARGQNPFHFRIGHNEIGEDSCRGALQVEGHAISWDLQYRSTFRVTLSNKGWIGFSRTPHSDAVFSGQITLDGRSFEGSPLGFGVQGHNCGYRHRNFWTWTHAYFPRAGTRPSTLEALVYEMPFGLVFRKAVLWHDGKQHEFRNLQEIRRDPNEFVWKFSLFLEGWIPIGSGHRWRWTEHPSSSLREDRLSGSFEVANNSLARAVLRLERRGRPVETLETDYRSRIGDGRPLELIRKIAPSPGARRRWRRPKD